MLHIAGGTAAGVGDTGRDEFVAETPLDARAKTAIVWLFRMDITALITAGRRWVMGTVNAELVKFLGASTPASRREAAQPHTERISS
jgi:hypothetical protein